jgi:hypothetical protein
MRAFVPSENVNLAISRLYDLGQSFDVDRSVYRDVIGKTDEPAPQVDEEIASDAAIPAEVQEQLKKRAKRYRIEDIRKQQEAAYYARRAADQILGPVWAQKIKLHLEEFIKVPAEELGVESRKNWEAKLGRPFKKGEKVPLKGRARLITSHNTIKAFIELSFGYPREKVKQTAFHEAFHHVWNMLNIPASEKKKILSYYDDNLETLANAFGEWAKSRFEDRKKLMHKPVRNFFHKLKQFLDKLQNWLVDEGFYSPEQFFEKVWDRDFEFLPDEEIIKRHMDRTRKDLKEKADGAQLDINKNVGLYTASAMDESDLSPTQREEVQENVETDPANPYGIDQTYSKNTVQTFLKPYTRKGKLDLQRLAEDTDITLSTNNPKDIYKATSLIQTMQDYAHNYPELKRLLNVEQERAATSHQLNMQDRQVTNPYFELTKSRSGRHTLKKVNKALIYGDKINRYISNNDLRRRFGLNEDGIKAYWSIRKVLDNKLQMILRQMIGGIVGKRSEKIDIEAAIKALRGRNQNIVRKTAKRKILADQLKVSLEELGFEEEEINTIAGGGGIADWALKRRAYIPHSWKTEWVVKVRTNDDKDYMFEVPSVKGRILPTRQQREDAAFKDAMKVAIGKLGSENLKDVRLIHSRHIPIELFDKTSVATMKSIVESASDMVSQEFVASGADKEYVDLVKNKIQKYMEQLYLAKGWGRHLIPRKGTPGFREDLEKVLPEYLINFNAYHAKGIAAREFSRAMKNINPRNTPNMWRTAKEFISDMLGDITDAPAAKRLAGIYFLAGDLSAATLNMTQNWTHAVAMLRKIGGKKLAETQITEAMRDVAQEYFASRKAGRKVFTASNKWIKSHEIAALREAYERGVLDPQYFGEVTGFHDDRWYQSYISDTQRLIFKAFTGSEAWNRMSTFLAAYRRAKDAGEKDPVKVASETVNAAHFIYGRGNRPEIVRKMGYFGAVGYTFMTYPVNNIVFLKHRVQDRWAAKTKEEKRLANKVVLSNLAYIFAFGGLNALPFAFLAKLIYAFFTEPEDDWEKLIYEGKAPKPFSWVHWGKMVPDSLEKPIARGVVRGIPAVFGNDMSWRVEGTDILGAPIGFQTMQTIYRRAIKRGFVPISRGDYAQGLFMMMPDFLMNPYRAFFAEGGTGIEGLPPIEYTPGESVWKAMGFTPTRETETWASQRIAGEKRSERLDDMRQFADRYNKALEGKDMKSMAKLRKEVNEYNITERSKGIEGIMIPWDDVRKSAKRRREAKEKGYPERMPKYMRPFQKELSKTFGLNQRLGD